MDEKTGYMKEKEAARPQNNQNDCQEQKHDVAALPEIEHLTHLIYPNVRERLTGPRCLPG
jgi:hypothetical protein